MDEAQHWAHAQETEREFIEWMQEKYPHFFTHRREDMPLVKDMVQSKYLRKEDVPDDETYTIKGVRQDNLAKEGTPDEMRWVMGFQEQNKPMVLNITSIRVLEQAFGGDTDDWKGKKVIVYTDPNVSFGGKVVGGLRLRIPKQKAAEKAAKVAADDDFDNSEIPF